MAYRRSMGGMTSRPPRSMVPRAFGGTPGGGLVMGRQSMVPGWYQAMQGTTLGEDTLDAMSEDQFRREMIAGQKALLAEGRRWSAGDRLQKWLAIGATLAIPLSAAIWRQLGIGQRRRREP